MNAIFYLLLIAGVIFSLIHFFQVVLSLQVKEMVEEFPAKFPGRCMICSFREYGLREGFSVNHKPTPHDCIESNDNV